METLSGLWSQLRPRGESAEEVAAEEERKRAVVEKLARAIVARRLEAPATLFLELNRPLGFIYSQAAFFARPFLNFFLSPAEVQAAAEVLDDPKAMEALLDRIGVMSEDGRRQAPAQRRRGRE
jgi:hypothetical protein